ncbi:MAG: enoyl-CoA hydratase-related protein [Pseudomonadota bacterium]|nr:enoyl-CoA hydratase-related protein [Pseudomonadota bacterium]
MVGLANTTEMLMLGTPVDGAEAARIGLATKVVPPEELEDAAALLGRQLAAGPARAQAVLREAFAAVWDLPLMRSGSTTYTLS